jgi:transposase-like protein
VVCDAAGECVNGLFLMLSIAISAQQLEVVLAAGELACPVCSGSLSRWGFARSREIRTRDGVRSLRPRRALCAECDTTHVLCPAWSVPRRRDSAEVIGEALRLAVDGDGHRRIARQLDRAPGTVRGWLRAARRRAGELRACASRHLVALDVQVGAVSTAGSELGDAVEAMMLAVRAFRLRFGVVDQAGAWERAVWLTGGLLHGRPPPPS